MSLPKYSAHTAGNHTRRRPLDEDDRLTLVEAIRNAYADDWALWELPGLARTFARGMGVGVTDDEVREIVREAVPHAVA